MIFTDTITRIRNACMMKHKQLTIPHSSMNENIIKCLCKTRYIKSYEVIHKGKFTEIVIQIKYIDDRTPFMREVKAISKPSLRKYASVKQMKAYQKNKIYVISTPKGIMLNNEAIENNVGGEVLFYIS